MDVEREGQPEERGALGRKKTACIWQGSFFIPEE
jgi:hypothetical protein